VRVFFLLVDEPFYTAACIEPLVDRWRGSIVGAAFPRGFFDWQRVKSSLQLYGISGTAARVFKMARASIGGGSVHRQFASRGIGVCDVDDVNARAFLDELTRLRVDLIVSLNCPQRLKRPILSLPARGCINVHFGKLPKYRGILPIFYALLNRETSFGVTIHMMDEKLDNGEIVAQRDVAILPGDTLETLYPKGFQTASQLLDETLQGFAAGRIQLLPNHESEKSYYSYPTWRMVRAYHRLVRG
jgi:methionyl-tRNA formyltransferase